MTTAMVDIDLTTENIDIKSKIKLLQHIDIVPLNINLEIGYRVWGTGVQSILDLSIVKM